MSDPAILKNLSRETKALILVSEFEARRMPMFQMRAVLDAIANDDEERKVIIDLVENDLRATGYHPNQVAAFLNDLLNQEAPKEEANVRATRRLRSPFAQSFAAGPGGAPAAPSMPAAQVPGFQPPNPVAAPRANLPPPPKLPGLAPPSSVPPPGTAVGVPKPSDSGVVPAVPAQPKPPAASAQPKAPAGPATPVHPVPAITAVRPRPGLPAGAAPVKLSSSQEEEAKKLHFGGKAGAFQIEEKPRVLLADDDKRIRIVFRLCLEKLGCQVVEAEDGTQAWETIQKGGISLVVMDMKMPGLHGLEVISRMKTQHIDLPVVVCSAYDQLKDEFVIASKKNLRYLVKPVAVENLEGAVRELIEIKA
ncbi:MAG: response regulator [Planctomycetes bacterium]|nr:response regulator [Planctomycetota bacterium]